MAHQGPGTANSLSLGPLPPVLSGPVSEGLSGITIHSIPSHGTLAKDYPSYRVNRSLLDLTTADFAITHDDDWREAVVNAANDPAVNRIYSEDLAEQVRRIMRGNVMIKNGVAFLVGDAARHIPVVTSTEQTAQRDTPRQPTTLGDREQEPQTNPPQQSSSDPSIYAPQQGLYSPDLFVSGAATSRTPAAPSFDPLSADDDADFEDPVFNSGTKPHPSPAGPSTQRRTGAGQEERAKWAFVLDTDGGQGSPKMSDSIEGVQNVIPPFISAERGKDKNRERTNMAPEAEEWWLSGIGNGVYKVVQKSQGAQQRLHIVPHRNGVRYPNHDTSDGPSITIHKHSKAFAFSISRRYSPKTALNAQGQSSLSARPSRMPVRSPSRMVLLASGKVQEAYHSTTAQLNNYGLPSHGGRLARMQKEDAHGRDEQPMTPEKEKGKGKYRNTPSSRSNLMVDESSLDNGSGRVSADHRHGPGIASTSQLPQSRTKQPVVDDTVRSQGTVPFDGAIAYQEQGSEFLLNNEDNGWKAPTRIPPADTHIIWPKDLKIPLPENHTVPWLTSQPRLREEEFGTSTPNARLLAVEDRASQKRRKRRQRSLSEPRNVFANIPAGMPYMLLPLWPGETDLGSDIQTPFTIPHIPDEKRLYLLIQYPPSEPPPPPQDERGHDAHEISSQGFPTLSRDLVRADKTTLFQRFHIFAKVVTHGDIQRSGVRIPDAGLSVFGSLQEAYESMPQERHVHTGFAIIGFYDSRGGGVEFFPEGLEKLGVVNCELDRNASVRPEDDASSKDQEEPDSTPVLTPIGFAVVEMAWLGAMALSRFR
ncbi:hypothetical protein BKA70DRAFT_1184294 [Coprinopsis sp. MPI-PUGE-AT-0042]|nr:hypothetical protein BKA70DRAFT_1184294 [Coprinopsis sp. MPI-PUGE-AT-0042]